MEAFENTSLPCYSARVVIPFVRLLERDPAFPTEALGDLVTLDPDERIPIAIVHELLAMAIHLTGDPDIGLKAASDISLGDYGALEYAARSAATWAETIAAAGRYMRLVNDALRFSFHTEGDRVLLQLDSVVPLPRAAADFVSAAFHCTGSQFWAADYPLEFEVWFSHPRPPDCQVYERTFSGGVLRFDAPFNGFTAPRSYLELPTRSADPQLHALIRKHADAMLAELPRARSLTERVRDLLTEELAGGTPSLGHIARKVSMSERTLSRHLEEEGTTFKILLEDLRRRLALGYVRNSVLPLSEVAFLLGFSQAAAFHRAFRRWTNLTPLEYRRAPRDPAASGGA